MKTESSTNLVAELGRFVGTSQYYFHPLYAWMKYTDGVKYFCEHAGNGAYWFLDIIGTELKKPASMNSMLWVNLMVSGDEASIYARNGSSQGRLVYNKNIPWTDCPPGKYLFYLQNGVFFLQSEY